MTDKQKKEIKLLEKLLKEMYACSGNNKEKQKSELCNKLIDIFDNSLEITYNFELLLSSIEDVYLSTNIQYKKLWLKLVLNIIRFRNEYREKCFNKIMQVAQLLENQEDVILKCKAIQVATNCGLYSSNYSKQSLLEFFFFECILSQQMFSENIFITILNLIQNENNNLNEYDYIVNINMNSLIKEDNCISKFLLELIIEAIVLISLNKLILLKDATIANVNAKSNILQSKYNNSKYISKETNLNKIEEEKRLIKILLSFFDYYVKIVYPPRPSIFKSIIYIYCYVVNFEREYYWKSIKNYFFHYYPRKTIAELLEILKNTEYNNNKTLEKNSECKITSRNECIENEFNLIEINNNNNQNNNNSFVFEFSSMDRYLFYDHVNDKNEQILLVNFLNYIKISQDDISIFLFKSKHKLIMGAIYFIGMSVWGYEKIDKLDIPYTVILNNFLKLSNENNKAINKEIIFCLKRLIKKFGSDLFFEWDDVFKILFNIIHDINKFINKYKPYADDHINNKICNQIKKTEIVTKENSSRNSSSDYNFKSNNNRNIESVNIQLKNAEVGNESVYIHNTVNAFVYFVDVTYKSIYEIIDFVKLLIINNNFYGCKLSFNALLDIINVPNKYYHLIETDINNSNINNAKKNCKVILNTNNNNNNNSNNILTDNYVESKSNSLNKQYINEILFNNSKNIYLLIKKDVFDMESYITEYLLKYVLYLIN